MSNAKLPLPAFLQMLTSSNLPTSKAMGIAGKIYKTYNTRSTLAQLDDLKLQSAGVSDKEERKLVLAAIKKAGYSKPADPKADFDPVIAIASTTKASSSHDRSKKGTKHSGSSKSKPDEAQPTARKKRKRDDDLNEFLPDHAPDDGESYGSLEFNEILDEEVLMSKSTFINRAPIMTAWSFIVAERLGFQREEALSIATVYTEMNAISKGVSLGIYDKGKGKGVEAVKGGSQPYVDLMGRRPLYQTSSGQWRALSKGTPVAPGAAYSYITRTLRQTAPQIVGALRLLGTTYSPAELNEKGYAIYAEFRPEVDGWGKRAEVKCSTILALRKKVEDGGKKSGGDNGSVEADKIVKIQTTEGDEDDKEPHDTSQGTEEPSQKKSRGMTLEEYEAALDADDTFDDLDLSMVDVPGDPLPTKETDSKTRI